MKCSFFSTSGLMSISLSLIVLFEARRSSLIDSSLSLRRSSYKYRFFSLFFHLFFILSFQHSISPLQCRFLYSSHSSVVLIDWFASVWDISICPLFLHSLSHDCTSFPQLLLHTRANDIVVPSHSLLSSLSRSM